LRVPVTIIFCNNPKNVTENALSECADDATDWGDWSIHWRTSHTSLY